MEEDARALNLLALALWGSGADVAKVESILHEAQSAAERLLAGTLINTGTLLKAAGQYGKALDAAYQARAIRPDWYAPHLLILAVLEYDRRLPTTTMGDTNSQRLAML